ncbi:MAG: glycoside hydrolase family 3 C-terminal domain-containing protein [Steroidobacteraceae bacterium]
MLRASLAGASGAPAAERWLDAGLDPDTRAELALGAMTADEKFSLLDGFFGAPQVASGYVPPSAARSASAGYVPGIERLGIPPQWQTDAGIGVASQRNAGSVRERTVLPSGLATAATWDTELAFRGGAMIGSEARASGFNVMLAGGVNLLREPRNGRNFEYAGEDPLLAASIVAAQVRGIQSNHIVSTIKHYALNDQETGRTQLSVQIEQGQARQSDLLAFEIAIERAEPGAIMCAYNRVYTVYACENPWLLSGVLKGDWHYPGYVMSDWGAMHSTVEAANAGLDQESAGLPFDRLQYFREALREATASGAVSAARLDDMVRRILRSLFASGAVDHPVAEAPIDFAADAAVSQADAEASIVMLRNQGSLLPLGPRYARIAVIGAHADVGVLSGGGSAQVYPVGGTAVPGLSGGEFPRPIVYDPSAPMAAIAMRLPSSTVRYASGADPLAAAQLAAQSDLVVLFAQQWTAESQDASLSLTDGQDELIDAVARANPHVVVVLETGGPVLMPWLDQVGAVLEAWYPGSRGGEAIARVLFGEVDAAGRLPVSFPRSESQLPRPQLDGLQLGRYQAFDVHYEEGAAVGYKWYDRQALEPLFPFGFGLSYGRVRYSALKAELVGSALSVSFDVHSAAQRAVSDTPQIYVASPPGAFEAPKRLAGWKRVMLAPGASTHVRLTVDPRLLASWDTERGWVIAPGRYTLLLAESSRLIRARVNFNVPEETRLAVR